MLVAVGDSITRGYGRPVAGVPLVPWVQLVADAVGLPLLNLAEDGAAVVQMAERQLPRLPRHAELAMTMLGANDANGWGFEDDYLGGGAEKVVAALADCADTLLLATLPAQLRQSDGCRYDALMRDRVKRSNLLTRRLAHEYGALLVDLAETFTGRRWMLGHDRLHWNAAGHRVVARAASGVLADADWATGPVPPPPEPDRATALLDRLGQVRLRLARR